MENPVTSAAAPASATAPAAAPASTPSTPVTPSSAGPSATSPATTGAAASTAALSPDAAMQAMVDAAKAKGFGDDLSATVKPAETVTDTPAADAAAAVTADKPAAVAADEPDYTFDEDGFVGARDLAQKIDSNDALKASLPAELRNEIMANARLAEVGAAYREMFSSPEEAKIIAQTAQDHAAFSEAYSLIQSDPGKGTTGFIKKLIEASALRNPDGSLMMHEDGKTIKTDGTANAFVAELGKRWIGANIVDKVKALGNDDVSAALDLVMESVGLRPSTADKTGNEDPALTARKAELDAQEARIKAERETSQTQARQQYQTALDGELVSLYETETGRLLEKATGLDKLTRGAVEKELEKAIKAAIKADTAYQMRKRELQRQPRTAERRQEEVALAKGFFHSKLAKIAKPIFAEAGITATGKVEQRTAAAAARAEGARSEVNGGAPAASGNRPGVTQSPQQQTDAAREAYKAENGRYPDSSELNIFMMLQHAKAKGFAA